MTGYMRGMGGTMKEETKTQKKRNDRILIGSILIVIVGLLAVTLILTRKRGNTAVVTVDGTVILEQALTQDCSIPIQTGMGYNQFQIQNGVASVVEADCRDQICVEHKGISNKGETIVCLPHKLIVEIK